MLDKKKMRYEVSAYPAWEFKAPQLEDYALGTIRLDEKALAVLNKVIEVAEEEYVKLRALTPIG